MNQQYACTKCGIVGDLEHGETPDSINCPKCGPSTATAVKPKTSEDLLRELGVDPSKVRRIVHIPPPR